MTNTTPTTPKVREALIAAHNAPHNALLRVRGGFSGAGQSTVVTVRTVNAMERDNLLERLGMFGSEVRLTTDGRALAAQVAGASTPQAAAA